MELKGPYVFPLLGHLSITLSRANSVEVMLDVACFCVEARWNPTSKQLQCVPGVVAHANRATEKTRARSPSCADIATARNSTLVTGM